MNWIKTSARLPTDNSQEVVIQNKAGKKFIARIHFHDWTAPAWDVEDASIYFDVWEYCYWTELPPLPEEQG